MLTFFTLPIVRVINRQEAYSTTALKSSGSFKLKQAALASGVSHAVSEITHFYTYTYFFECTLRENGECAKNAVHWKYLGGALKNYLKLVGRIMEMMKQKKKYHRRRTIKLQTNFR